MRLIQYINRLLLFLIILFPSTLLAIGEWNIYNSVINISQIQLFNGRIYGIAGPSLVSFSTDPLCPDYVQHSRNNGLTGKQAQLIAASIEAECLAIVYKDCNIDIIYTDGTIVGVPDIANKALAGDKTINSIQEIDGMLYLACSFGVQVLDLKAQSIPVSINTPYSIDFAFSFGNNLYRYSSKKKLEYCPLSDNVADNTHWKQVITQDLSQASLIPASDHNLCWLLSQEGKLLQLHEDNTTESLLSEQRFKTIHRLTSGAILASDGYILLADTESGTFTPNTNSPINAGNGYAYCYEDDCYFLLHPNGGIYYMTIEQNDPDRYVAFKVDFDHVMKVSGINTLYMGEMQLTPSGIIGISRLPYTSGQSAAHALSGSICRYDIVVDDWNSLNIAEAIASRLQERTTFIGLTGIAVDPTDPSNYAISTALHGLYIMNNDTLVHRYDDLAEDGIVQAFGEDFLSARVSAVAYDDAGRLFYTNSVQDTVLRCLLPDGSCIKYPNEGMAQVPDARRILLSRHDPYNIKWVLNDYGYQKSRVGMYYDKGNPANVGKSDYQTAWFSTLVDQDGNEYVPYYIYDLCEDLDGKVWVLTNLGPFVIENQATTFDYAQKNPGKGKVRRVKIPRNDGTNLADYLMQSTVCSCMAIDNFNRKWIGTSGAGLYLLSEDCITEIEHFSSDNSPLLSDDILNLCYDAETGILFISCEGGVLTYQTDAIEGEEDFSSLHCYPNPVRPEYSGELRIMGLMNDSHVSITAANGDLIFQTRSQGATATWDLHLPSGARVKPGIYLIHGVDEEGKNGKICKVLVL